GEEEFCRVVRGDPRRHDHADSSGRRDRVPHQLREDGIRVDAAATAQRESATAGKEMAVCLVASYGDLVLAIEDWVRRCKGLNEALAPSPRRVRDRRISDGKELLFLELDLVPRRVAENHV